MAASSNSACHLVFHWRRHFLKSEAEEFRRHAVACLRSAQRISGSEHLKRMMEMALQWLYLAQAAEIGPPPFHSGTELREALDPGG